ncbi:MAG: efflux RND transporter permease subunit [Boseongicola sp. SB0662_bin_57]|nr:efflux RND transporter permease subunit [Boseongicola sp. SB0662_bin_57]
MKRGPISYFAGNPTAANLLMILLVFGGIIASFQLAVRPLPAIDLRKVVVTVESPYASPREMEEDVNRRIEESIVGLEGVARVVSEAKEGVGRIEVELDTLADIDAVFDDVSNAVDSIENFPPANAELPQIEIKRLHYEVLTIAVSSKVLSEDALRVAAEDIFNELLALPSVSQIRFRGTRDREIAIEIDEEELRRHNLTIAELAKAVRRESLNLSFGELHTDAGDVVLNVQGKKRYGEEFEDIPLIARTDGTKLRLGEVARVRDGFVNSDILSEVDGVPTVFLRIEVAEGQSFTRTADVVKDWLERYQPPPAVEVSIWNDASDPLSDRFADIFQNAVIGVVLVFACLILVFDLRVAIWITVGIPLSFVASFMFFDVAGLTLNLGTMLALFVLIGIVVDDALVVGESIATEQEGGKSGFDAAVSGARTVAAPVTVGVITTILAFVPFLFVTVENYQIIQVFFYVALFVLVISLIEAFCILPAHLSHDRPWSLSPLRGVKDWICERIEEVRDVVVVRAVSWSVRHVLLTFAFAAAFVVAALALVRFEAVNVIVFDRAASVSKTMHADLRLPVGAPFGASVDAAERFVAAAQLINEQLEGTSIESISVRVGELSDSPASRTGQDRTILDNVATVALKLHDRPTRRMSPEDIEHAWRQNVGHTPELEEASIHTARVRGKPSVAYALVHDDLETLHQAAAELKSFMNQIPGLYALTDSLSPGKRHFDTELTPVAEAAGLTSAMVSKQLRASFHGLEVQRIQRGRDEIKVVVRYPPERRRSVRELANEWINIPGGKEIPLSSAAILTEQREPAKLIRIDGRQAALVNAQADLTATTPVQARRRIAEEVLPGLVAKYPGLVISHDAGARDEREMLQTLAVVVPIVLLAIYGLIASFLRSYWKPFVIVIGIPIAAAGAVFGHWALGWHLTAVSIFGIIGASGVIVNDGLVLLHRYSTLRRQNEMLPAIAAISGAARDRFRAVFLTSLTTVLGLSPLLYERSDELLFIVPFAVSMLGGLVASTAFTLFVLPAIFMSVEGWREG